MPKFKCTHSGLRKPETCSICDNLTVYLHEGHTHMACIMIPWSPYYGIGPQFISLSIAEVKQWVGQDFFGKEHKFNQSDRKKFYKYNDQGMICDVAVFGIFAPGVTEDLRNSDLSVLTAEIRDQKRYCSGIAFVDIRKTYHDMVQRVDMRIFNVS